MALTPKAQMKQLAIGTLGAFITVVILILTSQLENTVLFYLLSAILIGFVIYAIPGYIGMWVWRMRKTLFNLD